MGSMALDLWPVASSLSSAVPSVSVEPLRFISCKPKDPFVQCSTSPIDDTKRLWGEADE